VAPGSDAKRTVSGGRGSGQRRTLIALLLVVVVGEAGAWFVGRPYLSQQIAGNVGGVVDDELEAVPDMFARLDGRPVSVKTRDDTLVITTEPLVD